MKSKQNNLFEQLYQRLEKSEREMSVSAQKYRYLFENASDAIWVQDVDGLFLDGNRAFEKLTGFKMNRQKLDHVDIEWFTVVIEVFGQGRGVEA